MNNAKTKPRISFIKRLKSASLGNSRQRKLSNSSKNSRPSARPTIIISPLLLRFGFALARTDARMLLRAGSGQRGSQNRVNRFAQGIRHVLYRFASFARFACHITVRRALAMGDSPVFHVFAPSLVRICKGESFSVAAKSASTTNIIPVWGDGASDAGERNSDLKVKRAWNRKMRGRLTLVLYHCHRTPTAYLGEGMGRIDEHRGASHRGIACHPGTGQTKCYRTLDASASV